jgi:peptidoglycan/LPS O-acetylase OafA/YrhL
MTVAIERLRPTSPVDESPPDAPGRRVDAFDGIRAAAVGIVVLSHAGMPWMKGGPFGVSVFFTLSGFLITGLLLDEVARSGTIRLGTFWDRRFRRLVPAAAVTVVVVSSTAQRWLDADPDMVSTDALFSGVNLLNWRFLFGERSYTGVFGNPAPLQHFWSLAIEEQFYLLFPMLALAALRRGGRRCLGQVLVVLCLASTAAAVFAPSPDWAYYSTGSRAVELLGGALLAVVVRGREARLAARARLLGWAGTGAAVLIVAMAVRWDQHSRFVQHGGLAFLTIPSCLLVLAAGQPNRFARMAGVAPLRWIGLRSYGIYLYHWPIFLVLAHRRPGWSPWHRLAVGGAATLVLAAASSAWLEQPIRRWRPDAAAWKRAVVPATAVLASVCTAAVVPMTAPTPFSFEGTQRELAVGWAEARADLAPGERALGVFGDSTALMTGYGLTEWGRDAEGRAWRVAAGSCGLGCPLGRGGEVPKLTGFEPVSARCGWDTQWKAQLDQGPLDAAVVQLGPWDATRRRLPGEHTVRQVGDPVFDQWLGAEIDGVLAQFAAYRVGVVWLTSPHLRNVLADSPFLEFDPRAMDRLNQLIRERAAKHPNVRVVELGAHVDAWTTAEDLRLRPDGIHLSKETSVELAETWLGPQVLAAVDAVRYPPPAPPLP